VVIPAREYEERSKDKKKYEQIENLDIDTHVTVFAIS
jgi:hypothetical protein